MYYFYRTSYENTIIYSVFSNLLYDFINGKEITLMLENDIRFFPFKEYQKKISFEIICEGQSIMFIVNVFNYFMFPFALYNDHGEYDFVKNEKYEENFQ